MYVWVSHLSKSRALKVFFSYAYHTYCPGITKHVIQFWLINKLINLFISFCIRPFIHWLLQLKNSAKAIDPLYKG